MLTQQIAHLNMFVTILLLVLGSLLAGYCAGMLLRSQTKIADPRDISLLAFLGTAGISILYLIASNCGIPLAHLFPLGILVHAVITVQLLGTAVWMLIRSEHRSPYILTTFIAYTATFALTGSTLPPSAIWLYVLITWASLAVLLFIALLFDIFTDNIYPMSKTERFGSLLLCGVGLAFAGLRTLGQQFILF